MYETCYAALYQTAALRGDAHMVAWVCITPFGIPVVPEVYGIAAISSYVTLTDGGFPLNETAFLQLITPCGTAGSVSINCGNFNPGFSGK
jgi:hypothetical protein